MTGLTDRAVGETPSPVGQELESARQRWEASMLRHIETLRAEVRLRQPAEVARACGAALAGEQVRLAYWGRPVAIAWPDLEPRFEDAGAACPPFDAGMLLYYLRQGDGVPVAGRWIGFRELPDGGFYHLAYQRYSGDRLAQEFGTDPVGIAEAARQLHGRPLEEIGPHAFAFDPLPRIRLAAIVWPGDDEFPARGAILFDAAAPHYMTTDGLGLLGGGLAGRLTKARSRRD